MKKSLTNFNPRSREGSDWTVGECTVTKKNFNPRSREGSDGLYNTLDGSLSISIHAPAKGATFLISNISNSPIFQSTLPRRERLDTPACAPYFSNFNPRSREGSDSRQVSHLLVLQISIHAPAKGATQYFTKY